MSYKIRIGLCLSPRIFSLVFAFILLSGLIPVGQGQTVDTFDGVEEEPTFEPDFDDNPVIHTTRRPRFHRFNRFMTTINNFFSEGNWMKGGPENIFSYLGRTISRLIDILLNRDTPDYSGMAPASPRPRLPSNSDPVTPISTEPVNSAIPAQPDVYEGEVPKANDGFAGYRESITRQMNEAGFNKKRTEFNMKDIMKLVSIAEQLNNMQKQAGKLNGIES